MLSLGRSERREAIEYDRAYPQFGCLAIELAGEGAERTRLMALAQEVGITGLTLSG